MDAKELALKELAIRKLEELYAPQRADLIEFIKEYFKGEAPKGIKEFLASPFHYIIADRLHKVMTGEITRLIINIPPGHGKTELITKSFPVWALGNKPYLQIISTGYSTSLTQSFSQEAKEYYTSQTYKKIFPRSTNVRKTQDTKEYRINEDGGSYYATGTGGTITGKRANCLSGDTLIETDYGKIPISELETIYGKVRPISYNHATGSSEYKKILAFRKSHSTDVYEITLSTGDKIRATGEHRFFVLGQGYKETQNIQRGDFLMKEVTGVSKMLKRKMRKVSTLPGLLFGVKKDCNIGKMLRLGKKLVETNEGSKKSGKEMTDGNVLRSEMFWEFCKEKILKKVSKMLKCNHEQDKKILFGGLQKKVQTGEQRIERHKMQDVLKHGKSCISFNKVLLKKLQGFISFTYNEMKSKSKLQTWYGVRNIPKGILPDKEESIVEGLKQVCCMFLGMKTSHTSQRLQSEKQGYDEFGKCLPYTSHHTSRIQRVTVQSVVKLKEAELMYDIEVQDNHNFFANGFLTHNCFIIDDPIKPDEAESSEVVRTGVNNRYDRTVISRLFNPVKDAIIIIMQRTHDEDLCGYLQDKMSRGAGEKFEILSMPAIAEEDEEYTTKYGVITRKQGEVLDQLRFPHEALALIKSNSATVFSTQYQQQPVNKDTQEFHEERFKYHGNDTIFPTPSNMRIYTAVDPAFKQGQQNDQSCIMTCGFVGENCYILEYTAGRISADELQAKIIYHIKKRAPEKVGIEAFQAQSMILTFLKMELQKQNLYVNLEEIKQTGDKLSKIRKLVTFYRHGLIRHKNGMEDLEHELKRFPRGKHDDIIDALQMVYDLYSLQPNSTTRDVKINISYDKNGIPVYNDFYQDDRLDNVQVT